MSNLKVTLDKVLKSLNNAATDLSTIEVTTLTGNVTKLFNGDEIDLVQTLKTAKGNVKGEVRLVAHTRIEFDQDATQFFNEDITEADDHLLLLHQEMIDSAIDSRNAFLVFLKELFD